MPSNKELAEEILALDPEAKTDGLKNDELAKLLSELKKAAEDTPLEGSEDTPPEGDPATAAARAKAAARKAGKKEVKPKPEYYVAPGCAVTTKRGIRSGDTEDEVRASDFNGGEKDLESLLKTGHVLEGD